MNASTIVDFGYAHSKHETLSVIGALAGANIGQVRTSDRANIAARLNSPAMAARTFSMWLADRAAFIDELRVADIVRAVRDAVRP